MTDFESPEPQNERSLWRWIFRLSLPLERETCIFILVSALDVFMTHRLLSIGGHRESNPIADYFFSGWGFKGMIYFKFIMVSIVCVIAQVIARQKIEVARRLLNLATLIVTGVVIYSIMLLVR